MQYNLQNSLLTNLKIGRNTVFPKPASWADIRKSAQDGHIRLFIDARYPIGFIAAATGGYSIDIDGKHYADYNSAEQFCMADWSDYTDTEGYAIDYPAGANKAHILDIYPQIENENINAFNCARVAASGYEKQGILWAHFNIDNIINLSKCFAYTEYYNDLLIAVTAKKNLLIPNGLDYCFDNTPNLVYLPKINYTNVINMNNFLTNAIALKNTVFDIREAKTAAIIGCYGTSSKFMGNLKSLRISNEAPFDSITSPQINVSYTGMNRIALVQLFNDLPYNVGYTVAGIPTISDNIVSNFSRTDNIQTSQSFVDNGQDFEFVFHIKTPSTAAYTGIFSVGNSAYSAMINFRADKKISANIVRGYGDVTSPMPNIFTQELALDTWYYIKWERINNVHTISYSIDGVNYTAGDSATCADHLYNDGGICVYGWHAAYSANGYTGSINLNNTYIKVNDDYWFRGQPAITKTLSCVGCTGTADLTNDDKAIAENKFWIITE